MNERRIWIETTILREPIGKFGSSMSFCRAKRVCEKKNGGVSGNEVEGRWEKKIIEKIAHGNES
jgi:hypothetical protein